MQPDDERRAAEPGDRAKVGELIRAIRVALLTTVDREGHFHSRPVQTLQVEADLTLWFFTDWSSPKVDELHHDVRVSLGYADPVKHTYVAISGVATLLRDPQKAKELWSIEQRAYYPRGPEDERLALLRVSIDRAEYWIAPARVSYIVAAAKATVTGTPAGVIGENRKVE
jgi:general stress protein 26